MKLKLTYTWPHLVSAWRNARRGRALLVALGISSALPFAAGCGDEFTSCVDTRTCEPASGGVGGEGGGVADSEGSTAGADNAGPAIGGASASGPDETHAGSAGKDSDANTAGAAGSGAVSPVAECEEGQHVCGTPGSSERTLCQGGQWVSDACNPEHVCAVSEGSCVPVPEECRGHAPGSSYCADNERIACNQELSMAERELCREKCLDGQCVPAECGDGQVHGMEACDDGNQVGGDGCSNDCTWGPKELVLGGNSSCVLFGNGWAKCWGQISQRLGLGAENHSGDEVDEMGANLPYIQAGGDRAVFSALDVSTDHACGIIDGMPWCWGDNSVGQLGIGKRSPSQVLTPERVDLYYPRAKSIAVGDGFSCALLVDGHVKCWGRGPALGTPGSEVIGDESIETGSHLPYLDLGDGSPPPLPPMPPPDPAIAIDAGANHACALLESGKILCWGDNSSSQLGLFGHEDNGGLPAEVVFAPNPVRMHAIALGGYHSCSLGSAGLTCWGANYYGQLGNGSTDEGVSTDAALVPISTTSDRIARVRGMMSATCALLESNALKCWGEAYEVRSNHVFFYGTIAQPDLTAFIDHVGDAPNELAQLPPIDFGMDERIVSFDTGAHHGCALFESGTIKCWGGNDFGQLGVGTASPVGLSADELGANWVETKIQ